MRLNGRAACFFPSNRNGERQKTRLHKETGVSPRCHSSGFSPAPSNSAGKKPLEHGNGVTGPPYAAPAGAFGPPTPGCVSPAALRRLPPPRLAAAPTCKVLSRSSHVALLTSYYKRRRHFCKGQLPPACRLEARRAVQLLDFSANRMLPLRIRCHRSEQREIVQLRQPPAVRGVNRQAVLEIGRFLVRQRAPASDRPQLRQTFVYRQYRHVFDYPPFVLYKPLWPKKNGS